MSKAATHNALARKFVMEVAGVTDGPAELMVVIESTILGAMLLLSKRDGFSPRASARMIEEAIGAATERFCEGGDETP